MPTTLAQYIWPKSSTSQRTKHVDVKYHFVREFVVDGEVKVIFVQSEDNIADIFTKNTMNKAFHWHLETFMMPNDENYFLNLQDRKGVKELSHKIQNNERTDGQRGPSTITNQINVDVEPQT